MRQPAVIARLRSGGQPFYLVRPAKSFGRIGAVKPQQLGKFQPPLATPKTCARRTDVTPERIRAASRGRIDVAAIARQLRASPDTVRRHAAGRIRLPNGRAWRRRESLAFRACIRIMADFNFTPQEIAALTGYSAVAIYAYNRRYRLGIRLRPYGKRRRRHPA